MSQNGIKYTYTHVDSPLPRTHQSTGPTSWNYIQVGGTRGICWALGLDAPHLHPMFTMCIRLQRRSLRRDQCVHEQKENNPSVLPHLPQPPLFACGVRLEGELQSTAVSPYQHSFNLPLVKNIVTHRSHRSSSSYQLPQKKVDQNKIRQGHSGGETEANFCTR